MKSRNQRKSNEKEKGKIQGVTNLPLKEISSLRFGYLGINNYSDLKKPFPTLVSPIFSHVMFPLNWIWRTTLIWGGLFHRIWHSDRTYLICSCSYWLKFFLHVCWLSWGPKDYHYRHTCPSRYWSLLEMLFAYRVPRIFHGVGNTSSRGIKNLFYPDIKQLEYMHTFWVQRSASNHTCLTDGF